jgi:hypothetical protein
VCRASREAELQAHVAETRASIASAIFLNSWGLVPAVTFTCPNQPPD